MNQIMLMYRMLTNYKNISYIHNVRNRIDRREPFFPSSLGYTNFTHVCRLFHFPQIHHDTDKRSSHYYWYKLHSDHMDHSDIHLNHDMCHHCQNIQSYMYKYSSLVYPNNQHSHHIFHLSHIHYCLQS